VKITGDKGGYYLSKGNYFGKTGLLINVLREDTAKVEEDCELLCISNDIYLNA
jgi:hypothetical protein